MAVRKGAAPTTGVKRKADETPSVKTPRRTSGRARKLAVAYDEESDSPHVTDANDDNGSSDDYHEEGKSRITTADEDVQEGSEEDDDEDDEHDGEAITSKMSNWRKGGRGASKNEMTIEIPQEQDAGGTPYEDGRLHQNTLSFLADLKKNNNREWLKWHDKPFRQAEKDFGTFADVVTTMVSEEDPTVPELPRKDLTFRIYRDIRFSPDPTPYKTHFSIAWSRTGRKGPYAAYYLQIQPGGGLWHPDSGALACLREDIDQRPHQIKSVLTSRLVKNAFFSETKKDEKKIVAAFVEKNGQNALKTRPKGFDADHPDLPLLRLRNFTLGKKLTDTEVVAENGIETIMAVIKALVPWNTYLNNVVMPDN